MTAIVQHPADPDIALLDVTSEEAEQLSENEETLDNRAFTQQGFLSTRHGKYYRLTSQGFTPQSQKSSKFISKALHPKEQKTLETKRKTHPLLDKMGTNKAQIQKQGKPLVAYKIKSSSPMLQKQPHRVAEKIPTVFKSIFSPPPSSKQSIVNPIKIASRLVPQQSTKQSKVSVRAEEKRIGKNEGHNEQRGQIRKLDEPQQQIQTHLTQEQEKTDEQQQQQRRQEDQDEEGFTDQQQRQKHEQPDSLEENKVSAIDTKEVGSHNYTTREAQVLKKFLEIRVNPFHILILFFELLKISLKGREQERIARMRERELQLRHIQNMVDNLNKQGKQMFFSNLGSGVLAIVSGLFPIIGHMKGNQIINTLSRVPIFNSIQGMDKNKFVEGVTKSTFAISEMNKSIGQIQTTIGESSRTFDQHMADIRRNDQDENTRKMDEEREKWKEMQDFMLQSLQMNHDAIRQLYN